jgi:hypothetical protein
MADLEERFYEITSCELPPDANMKLSLEQHTTNWFNQQISGVEESIIGIKKRLINANEELTTMSSAKMNQLVSDLESLRRRKLASKTLLKYE